MTSTYHQSDIDEIVSRLGDAAEAFAGKRVLISGGAGFLGRYFCAVFAALNRTVLSNPVQVRAMDSLITGDKPADGVFDGKAIMFAEADVTKPMKIGESVDYIIHAAGIASPFHYRRYPVETLDVAINGTRNLLELAKAKRARFTFFSSSEIYGDPDTAHVPTMESYRGNVSSMGPRACYDESKRVGETLCHIFHEHYDVETNCIRPFNVFGPGMRETDYRVLPNFASCIKGKRTLRLYGTGKQTRTYCYITDAMVGFFLVVLRGLPGQPYNIGCATPEISVHQLVDTLESVLGSKLDRQVIEHPDSYPADEPQRRCPDLRKAASHLDYKPERKLEEGLKRFLEWTDRTYTEVPVTQAPLVGLVGAGRWGRNILSTIRRTGDLRLAWVASRNPQTQTLLPPDCRLFTDWREAASGPAVAGVIVATPPASHAEIVDGFMAPGMAFFVEKPLTPDLTSTQVLLERLRAKNCALLVDHVHLFHPAFAGLTKNLHRIGRVTAIRAEAGNWGPFLPDIGVLWDWGAHDAAMCLAVLGQAATKATATLLERRTVDGGIGERVAIEAGFPGCGDVRIELSNLRREKIRRFTVQGTDGSLSYDPNAAHALSFTPKSGTASGIPVDTAFPLDRALQRFAEVIGEPKATEAEPGLAVGVAKFLDACQRSLDTAS